jgi:hypothetical protein
MLNFDESDLVSSWLSENPETVCAAGRLNKQQGSSLLPPRISSIALGSSIRRVFGGVGTVARLNASDFGLLGPPSMTMQVMFAT